MSHETLPGPRILPMALLNQWGLGAEQTLSHGEARLRMLARHVPAIIWSTDSRLTITSSLGAGIGWLPVGGGDLVGREPPRVLRHRRPGLPAHRGPPPRAGVRGRGLRGGVARAALPGPRRALARARRPGHRDHRRGLRRHRAAPGGGAGAPRRAARRPDAPAQPDPVHRPARARAGPRPPAPGSLRRAAAGPGPLQERQRQPRALPGRPPAGGGRAPPVRVRAPGGHRVAPGRRRVRDPARGDLGPGAIPCASRRGSSTASPRPSTWTGTRS